MNELVTVNPMAQIWSILIEETKVGDKIVSREMTLHGILPITEWTMSLIGVTMRNQILAAIPRPGTIVYQIPECFLHRISPSGHATIRVSIAPKEFENG
jgi:hypothetical protein